MSQLYFTMLWNNYKAILSFTVLGKTLKNGCGKGLMQTVKVSLLEM